MKNNLPIAGLIAAAALFVAPAASALATVRYVDDDGSATAGASCASTSDPCKTIAKAMLASAPGDEIHVGGGTYGENVSLAPGVSLEKASFSSLNPAIHTSGDATIDGGTDPAIFILQMDATPRIVSGFVLEGGGTTGSVDVTNPGTLTIGPDNTFDDAGASPQLALDSGSPRVTGNTFSGTDGGGIQLAISYTGRGSPVIDDNTIDTFSTAIQSSSGGAGSGPATPDIADNAINGIYTHANQGFGISITGAGTVAGNRIEGASSNPANWGLLVAGVSMSNLPVVVSRNRVFDVGSQNEITNVAGPVTLSDDVFGNGPEPLRLVNDSGGVTATGITASGSATAPGVPDISLSGTALTLDSSSVGDRGVSLLSASSCTSIFSRGPAAPGNCGFATGAQPLFVNPSGDNFRLSPGSPMIDAGNPAAPSAGELDVVGNPRAVLGLPGCTPRRDIGGFEFVPTPAIAASGCPAPVSAPPKKKCKKHRKLKHGKCVKKKHRKKHR